MFVLILKRGLNLACLYKYIIKRKKNIIK